MTDISSIFSMLPKERIGVIANLINEHESKDKIISDLKAENEELKSAIIDNKQMAKVAVETLQAENARLKKAILDFGNGQDFDWNVLTKIEEQEAEIERLKKLIIDYAKEGIKRVGHVYSGMRTTVKVEKMLKMALDSFQPIRKFIYEQEQALKGNPNEKD